MLQPSSLFTRPTTKIGSLRRIQLLLVEMAALVAVCRVCNTVVKFLLKTRVDILMIICLVHFSFIVHKIGASAVYQ